MTSTNNASSAVAQYQSERGSVTIPTTVVASRMTASHFGSPIEVHWLWTRARRPDPRSAADVLNSFGLFEEVDARLMCPS